MRDHAHERTRLKASVARLKLWVLGSSAGSMLIGGLSIYLLSPSHPKWLVCAIVGLVLTTPVLVGYALVGRLFRRSDPRF